MRKIISVTLFILILFFSIDVYAYSNYLTQFNNKYKTAGTILDTCGLCHTSGSKLNSFGDAFEDIESFNSYLENRDSDRDGFSNIKEIKALTFPGWSSSRPSTADIILPVISSFSIPNSSPSLTIPLSLVATDNVAITGYFIGESSSIPLVTSSVWLSIVPSSYTFTSEGQKTLYAWAKDAAGNISISKSSSVTITLPVILPPPPDPVINNFPDMSHWINTWFKVTKKNIGYQITNFKMQYDSDVSTQYFKIWNWDSIEGKFDVDIYQKVNNIWLSDSLTIDYVTGKSIDFLAHSQFFLIRFRSWEDNNIIKRALVQSLGGYYVEEDAAGGLRIYGIMIDQENIPVPEDQIVH